MFGLLEYPSAENKRFDELAAENTKVLQYAVVDKDG
jgi:hypothetical protein